MRRFSSLSRRGCKWSKWSRWPKQMSDKSIRNHRVSLDINKSHFPGAECLNYIATKPLFGRTYHVLLPYFHCFFQIFFQYRAEFLNSSNCATHLLWCRQILLGKSRTNPQWIAVSRGKTAFKPHLKKSDASHCLFWNKAYQHTYQYTLYHTIIL